MIFKRTSVIRQCISSNANGASLGTIQHTLRWRSASSAMVYARPDPAAGSALAADMRASPAGRARGATRQG